MSFTLPVLGHAPHDGSFDTPGSAMARGLAVVRSSDTVGKAGAGVVPYGFLNTEVTTDGPSYEERTHVPEGHFRENKVSEGKVEVIALADGVSYATSGVTKSGTTFAVGEKVYVAANGELTDDAGASSTHRQIGLVEKINQTVEDQTDVMVFQAQMNLGAKA